MDYYSLTILGVLLFGQRCFCQALFVSYQGEEFFQGNKNATLKCVFDPIPQNTEDIVVAWWKRVGSGNSGKIAVSSIKENSSYVYASAPASLKDRFSISSAEFDIGIAEATIMDIKIEDEATYECGVEDNSLRLAQRIQFPISVYIQPTVTIKDVNVNIDIRPKKILETTTAQPDYYITTSEAVYNESEDNTSSYDEDEYDADPYDQDEYDGQGGDTYYQNGRRKRQAPLSETTAASLFEEENTTTIAACHAYNSYPAPHKFTFYDNLRDLSWDVYEIEKVENTDGTFNSSAELRVVPDQQLDGKTIKCTAYITKREYATDSMDETSPITVRYLTSTVTMSIEPAIAKMGDVVVITCKADGNPIAKKYLRSPSGEETIFTSDPIVITIENEEQGGTYTCVASNDEEGEDIEDSKGLIIEWMDLPTIRGRSSAKKGESVTLVCDVLTNSPITYIWKKDDAQLQRGRELVLDSVNYSDGGIYTCVAHGPFMKQTQHTLRVEGACEISTFDKIVSASSTSPGEAYIKLTCIASGSPSCSVSLESSNSKLIEQNHPDHVANRITLEIGAIPKQKDALNFTCIAKNSHGLSSQQISLTESPACCVKARVGGLDVGVIIIIIILVIVLVVGLPLAYCFFKKRNASQPERSEKELEEGEADELHKEEEE